MLNKKEAKFIDDVLETQKLPKWIEPFRKKTINASRLPFILVFNAVGIGKHKGKGASIAIATANLQRADYLVSGTNTLTALGELRERALLKSIGKDTAESYVKQFLNM